MINRSQGAVLGFFAFVVVALVAILIYAPDVYAGALGARGGRSFGLEIGFLVALLALISVVVLGVIRRWRWLFWLLVVAFLAGVLRLPASAAQLAGAVPSTGPGWYLVLQGLIGLVQFVIGVGLLAGYRRAGVWGAF
ncbi:MAG TPA: hypothetical protein VFK22_02055 [Candidatus Dormibacteraeota bacterium]|nr:hypothetical protein [Candidatus Dormibacteraeota bacterium]